MTAPHKLKDTPFPNTIKMLSLANPDSTDGTPPVDTVRKNQRRGYRRGVGELLWISRNTIPELAPAVAFLTRMISAPSDQAFECMLHSISYAYNKRHTGLTYNSEAPLTPTMYTDASNKPDPKDGKCLGGHICVVGGAAVVWQCKKLRHVGRGSAF